MLNQIMAALGIPRVESASKGLGISPREARRARVELASIRRDESRMRYSGGRFSASEENVIHQRLDRLGVTIREDRDDRDRRPG